MAYIYKQPSENFIKVSNRDWNKFYAKCGNMLTEHVLYLMDDGSIVVHHYISIFGKLLVPFLAIPNILLYGWFETVDDFKGILFDKRLGKFSSDIIKPSTKGYEYFLAKFPER